MKPNDQLVYNVKTKAVNLRKVSAEEDGTSWRNKEIDLNDVTLAEAGKILGNAYGVKSSSVQRFTRRRRLQFISTVAKPSREPCLS